LKEHIETSLRHFRCLWPQSSLFTCSAVRAPSANGELVSIFQPGLFTFYSTQQAFPCFARSSGMSRLLELPFFCSQQPGPYSARIPSRRGRAIRRGLLGEGIRAAPADVARSAALGIVQLKRIVLRYGGQRCPKKPTPWVTPRFSSRNPCGSPCRRETCRNRSRGLPFSHPRGWCR
jgi:hypothetical protein